MPQQYDARPPTCPPWCELGHGTHTGEDDHVHIGGQLCVRNTLMRLCSTIDPATGEQDGPYLLMGTQEFTIDEVGELITALTALAAQAAQARAQRIPSPRGAT